jgi:hypothetical protein
MRKLNDSEIIRRVVRPNADQIPKKWVAPSERIEKIHAVKANGFVFRYGQATAAVGAIGMTLPAGHEFPEVLAVSGSGSSFIEQRNEIVAKPC